MYETGKPAPSDPSRSAQDEADPSQGGSDKSENQKSDGSASDAVNKDESAPADNPRAGSGPNGGSVDAEFKEVK